VQCAGGGAVGSHRRLLLRCHAHVDSSIVLAVYDADAPAASPAGRHRQFVDSTARRSCRTFTDRPLPAPGATGMMLSLVMDSRDAVDTMNRAAAAHGGRADVNPVQDLGSMYGRDLADPDDNLWGAFWMDPAARPAEGR
jgi:hypothetical protein